MFRTSAGTSSVIQSAASVLVRHELKRLDGSSAARPGRRRALIHALKVLKDRLRLKSHYVVCTEEAADITVGCGWSHRTSDSNQQCRNDPSKEAQWTNSRSHDAVGSF